MSIPKFEFAKHTSVEQSLFLGSCLSLITATKDDNENNNNAPRNYLGHLLDTYSAHFPNLTPDEPTSFFKTLLTEAEPPRYLFEPRAAVSVMLLNAANRKAVATLAQNILEAFSQLSTTIDEARIICNNSITQASGSQPNLDACAKFDASFAATLKSRLDTQIPLWRFMLRAHNALEIRSLINFYKEHVKTWLMVYDCLMLQVSMDYPNSFSSSAKPPYTFEDISWFGWGAASEFTKRLSEGLQQDAPDSLALVWPETRQEAQLALIRLPRWRELATLEYINEGAKSLQIALTLIEERIRYRHRLPLDAMRSAAMGNRLSASEQLTLTWWAESSIQEKIEQREQFVEAITPILCKHDEPQWKQLGRIALTLQMNKLQPHALTPSNIMVEIDNENIECVKKSTTCFYSLYKRKEHIDGAEDDILVVRYKGELLDRLAVMHDEAHINVYCPRPSAWEPSISGFWITSAALQPIIPILKSKNQELRAIIRDELGTIISTWWKAKAMPENVTLSDLMLEEHTLCFCMPKTSIVEPWLHINTFLKEIYNHFSEQDYIAIIVASGLSISPFMSVRNALICKLWDGSKLEPEDAESFEKLSPEAWKWRLQKADAFIRECKQQVKIAVDRTYAEYHCHIDHKTLQEEMLCSLSNELFNFGPVEWALEQTCRRTMYDVVNKYHLHLQDVVGVLGKHLIHLDSGNIDRVAELCHESGVASMVQQQPVREFLREVATLDMNAKKNLADILKAGAPEDHSVRKILKMAQWSDKKVKNTLEKLLRMRNAALDQPQNSCIATCSIAATSTSVTEK